MSTVICLIANPATTPLALDDVDRVRRCLPETEVEWLGPSVAAEVGPVEIEPYEAWQRARQAVEDRFIDVVALPFEGRKKRLLIADMDSTIIQVECVDELAAAVGLRERVSAITQRAMNGELDFEAALTERVALLAGLEETTLAQIANEQTPLTAGARTLVQTMAKAGAVTALVSGGFKFFTSRVAARCGFDHNRANVLELQDGVLTGRIEGAIQGQDAKVAALSSLLADNALGADDAIAIGDGANDIPMLKAAGLGVAFHAHQAVRAAVPNRLDVADLTGALYLQGYRRDDFVTD